MEKQYDTYIFDLDGTLLDTLDDLTCGVNYALTHHGFPVRSKSVVRSFLGNGAMYLLQCSVPSHTTPSKVEEVLSAFRTYYKEHCMDQTKPYPGILSLLEKLKTAGKKTAIVSNKPDFAVQELYRRFFLDSITIAIGESATVRRKPNPDALIEVMHQLNSSSEDTLYVGDSEVDIMTAVNAEVDCASVTWGFRDEQELKAAGAKTLIYSPQELYV